MLHALRWAESLTFGIAPRLLQLLVIVNVILHTWRNKLDRPRKPCEAQQRGALHNHILVWFKKRLLPNDYSALRPVEKTVKGNDWKQRPKNQKVDKVIHCRGKTADGKKDLRTHEDNIYHSFEIGRVWTEMVQ